MLPIFLIQAHDAIKYVIQIDIKDSVNLRKKILAICKQLTNTFPTNVLCYTVVWIAADKQRRFGKQLPSFLSEIDVKMCSSKNYNSITGS